jgi:hypothetical protein
VICFPMFIDVPIRRVASIQKAVHFGCSNHSKSTLDGLLIILKCYVSILSDYNIVKRLKEFVLNRLTSTGNIISFAITSL